MPESVYGVEEGTMSIYPNFEYLTPPREEEITEREQEKIEEEASPERPEEVQEDTLHEPFQPTEDQNKADWRSEEESTRAEFIEMQQPRHIDRYA